MTTAVGDMRARVVVAEDQALTGAGDGADAAAEAAVPGHGPAR